SFHTVSAYLLLPLSLHDALPISFYFSLHIINNGQCRQLQLFRYHTFKIACSLRFVLNVTWDVSNEAVLHLYPRIFITCRNVSRRSEEHTSELQSRFDLVCRLLLE